MAIPAHIRTWQFQVNNAILTTPAGTQTLCNRALVWAIKEALKGNGSWTDATGAATASAGNWTVVASSNSAVADANDNWTTSANCVWAAGVAVHSWIVLEQAGIPGAVGNLQICIDLHYAAEYSADIFTSVSAGFAGGTTTARPTAADEQNLNAAVGTGATINRWGGPDGNSNTVLHVMKTTTGTATRVIMTRVANNGSGSHNVGYWAFELPVATASFTAPSACIAQAQSGVTPSSDTMLSTGFSTSQVTWGRIPGGANFSSSFMSLGTSTRGEWSSAWGTSLSARVMNSIGLTEPMMEVALYSSTANSRGRNSKFVDLYQGVVTTDTSQFGGQGRTMPASGTLRQWVKFGDYYHPWNRSIPLVTA